jgi:hypothetical protein
MKRRLAVMAMLVSASLAAALWIAAGPVEATYPGVNGRLAFGLDTGDGNVDLTRCAPTAMRCGD